MIRLPPLRRLSILLLLSGMFSTLPHADSFAANGLESAPVPLLLAQNYQAGISPAGYLVSEKLDGVRAIWDGKNLRFRSGKLIYAPAWFTAKLPDHPLDGELWMGRRKFDLVSAAARRLQPMDEEWRNISYQVYELPGGEGSFSQRIQHLQQSVQQAQAPWLQVLPQVRVVDQAALQARLQEVVRDGGEGLMLHQADARWQTGRSDVLLKLKPQLDAEAKVIGHLPGKGKYQGMMGSLLMETPEGKRFRLGTGFSDEERRNPPAIGSIVTYRYRDMTSKGLPKFISFLRVREEE